MFDHTPLAWLNDYTNGIKAYESKVGPVLHLAYEGGVEHLIPGRGWKGRAAAAAWDAYAHPDAALNEQVFYSVCQSAGFQGLAYYAHMMEISNNGANWGLWNYSGQVHGKGDGSDSQPPNTPIAGGPTWNPHVSVRGQAWRDWQSAVLLTGAPH
jgi:hypothetical protein